MKKKVTQYQNFSTLTPEKREELFNVILSVDRNQVESFVHEYLKKEEKKGEEHCKQAISFFMKAVENKNKHGTQDKGGKTGRISSAIGESRYAKYRPLTGNALEAWMEKMVTRYQNFSTLTPEKREELFNVILSVDRNQVESFVHEYLKKEKKNGEEHCKQAISFFMEAVYNNKNEHGTQDTGKTRKISSAIGESCYAKYRPLTLLSASSVTENPLTGNALEAWMQKKFTQYQNFSTLTPEKREELFNVILSVDRKQVRSFVHGYLQEEKEKKNGEEHCKQAISFFREAVNNKNKHGTQDKDKTGIILAAISEPCYNSEKSSFRSK
ncbi:MAG: hypothetical protein KF702_01510 [Gammaproteobacteria bacterium]|nr:hypothetical protein [Gammaproteobacteria bacterium]